MKYLLRMQACGINVNKPLGSGLFAKASAFFSFFFPVCLPASALRASFAIYDLMGPFQQLECCQ